MYEALQKVAEAYGTTPADWIAAHLAETATTNVPAMATLDDWIDSDFLETCARQTDDSVSLETVRQAMAKIPGCLADDMRAERDER